MALPRTFVGFSSTDLDSYRLMCAWKEHEHIDFDFCDCQLQKELNSGNEQYIKTKCRERLQMAGTYIMLIGADTFYKQKFVLWEAEVAIEKGCRLIGVNLDKRKSLNTDRCPPIFRQVDAVFIPFSPQIIQYALENWVTPKPPTFSWYYFNDSVYKTLGYTVIGDIVMRPPKPFPWLR
jgi:hypothetical protein